MCTSNLTCRTVELNLPRRISLEEKDHHLSVMKRISPVTDSILPLEPTFKVCRMEGSSPCWRQLGWQVVGTMLREGASYKAPGFPIIKTNVCRLSWAFFLNIFQYYFPLYLPPGFECRRVMGENKGI